MFYRLRLIPRDNNTYTWDFPDVKFRVAVQLASSLGKACESQSMHIQLLTCRRAGGLTTLQHFLRPNKLFGSFIMKLLHVSQLVRITCAAARHKNCGGFSKFRLAWRRAEFFSGGGGAAGCRLAAEFGG